MYRNRPSNMYLYKSKLSDFGKHILESLINHRKQVPQSNFSRGIGQRDYKDNHKKKKLSYENSSIIDIRTNGEDGIYMPRTKREITQSEDLVVPLTIRDTSTVNTDQAMDNVNVVATSNTECIRQNQFKATLEKDSVSNDKICWDDMFDNEIIHQTNKINILTEKNLLSPSPILFNIKFNKSESSRQSNEVVSKTNKIKTTIDSETKKPMKIKTPKINIDCDIKKPIKRLKKQTKVSETKEIHITDVPNISAIKHVKYRKKNYNKTVENWLKDINNDDPIVDVKANDLDIAESDICKENNNNNKKVIQTCLVNKGGIMKYDKPKIMKKEIKENALEKENKRHKFTPPIRASKPIKDITYKVVEVDEQSYNNFTLDLECQNDSLLVLVYENGFSQLNEQYTDTTCVPEGLLMHFRSSAIYYYWRHQILNKSAHIRELLEKILTQIKIVCYEGKKILIYLAVDCNLLIDIHKLDILDVKIAGSLLDSDADTFGQLQRYLSCELAFTVATPCGLQKCGWYMGLLEQCADAAMLRIHEESLDNVFSQIEMRLLPIIADMEKRGVHVDIASLTSMEALVTNKMKAAELKCSEAAGKRFQINSALQVGNILYDELKLHSKTNVKIRETVGKGAKSTSESMLRSLMSVHPLPKHILEYRHLHKAYATFLAGISQHVKDGVVRPTWVQIASATGRITSANPNLQAIPKAPFSLDLFRDNNHDEQHKSEELLFRSVYVARAGCSLLAADFQHIECRVFACAANDQNLIDIFRQKHDFFKVLTSKWLNKDVGAVTTEERERSKRMVYAILYGAGTNKLMHILDMPYDQTLSIVTSFNRTFPSLKGFGREVVSECVSRRGRVRTGSGRRRWLPDVGSADGKARAHAERQAVNFVIQGSAADICKCAMVRSARALRSALPGAALLLQIHDELVWEVADHQLESAAAIIGEAMESCGRECGVDIPLPVAMSCGKNWGQLEPMDRKRWGQKSPNNN